MRKLLIIAVILSLWGCSSDIEEEYCLRCTETFNRDVSFGKLTTGEYLYRTVLIQEVTTIECSNSYVGPYKINGQADRPNDGTDFEWSYKRCIDE